MISECLPAGDVYKSLRKATFAALRDSSVTTPPMCRTPLAKTTQGDGQTNEELVNIIPPSQKRVVDQTVGENMTEHEVAFISTKLVAGHHNG